MFARVSSASLLGIDGIIVDVEADAASAGMPSFSVVGLAEGALKESRDRVRSSLKNLEYNIFARPITINLAPADFKKEGTHFDLPIALGLLAATENLPEKCLDGTLILGELSLDGRLRGVSGVISMAEAGAAAGLKRALVPSANASEAALISGLDVYAFDTIGETVSFLRGEDKREPVKRDVSEELLPCYENDFSEIRGQMAVRRAAEIAAAGMHNIIFIGSPGSGKTMIARRMPTILPPMTMTEALRSTKIHSAAGLLREHGRLISERPFVSPHHTASGVSVIGGGAWSKPGHVSIASGGVLFLDEMLEFSRNVLEALRQPLEDRQVTVARANRTVTYPADFMLVGAMNPCPCGYSGDKKKECTCTVSMIEKYRARLSGPMLDRIDMHIRVQAVDYKDLSGMTEGESSAAVRARVEAAQEIQRTRFRGTGTAFNSRMTEKQTTLYCRLDSKCEALLENALDKFNLSARSCSKILKTARTIADLDKSENIAAAHLLEALQMRTVGWE